MSETQNAQQVYADLVALGLPSGAAIGVVGNLVAESGVDPHSVQPNGPGMGIGQWSRGGRWDTLTSWAHSKGLDPYALSTQEQFMVLEMRQQGLWSQLQKTTDPYQASYLFMTIFERPADQSRANGNYRANQGLQVLGKKPSAGDILKASAWTTLQNLYIPGLPFTAQPGALGVETQIAKKAVPTGWTDLIPLLGKIGQNLTSRQFWVRIGMMLLGVAMIWVAVLLFLKNDAMSVASQVKKVSPVS